MSDADPDAEGSTAFSEWLSTRVEKDRVAAPSTLWHYTDAAGLAGILSSNAMWATNARFMNDSMELAHGIERARRALEDHDQSTLKDASKRFLGGLIDPEQKLIASFLDRTAEIFVTCFCLKGDLLSQWRGYSHKDVAGGYSIGFAPPGDVFAWPQSGGHRLMLRRVLYNPQEQDLELRDLVQRLVPLLDADPTDLRRQNAFGRYFVDGVVEAAAWCKHPAFAEEQEWRIVYVRTADPDPLALQHRTSSGLLIPFVSLPLPRAVGVQPKALPITRIKCGPSPDPDLKQRGVYSLLTACRDHTGVAVEGSSTPLRW